MSTAAIADELAKIYKANGSLNPETVVTWAKENPASALHARFDWDDSSAAHQHRLYQARSVITEVTVVHSDGKKRQVYVSLMSDRGSAGYQPLVEVMSDETRRHEYLNQVLAEYVKLGEKYGDLKEFSKVRSEVRRVEDSLNAAE